MKARPRFFESRIYGSLRAALLFVGVLSASCGEARETDQKQVDPIETRREPAVGNDQERFQQLRADTLRLMIAAAKRELEIVPFQRRINATITQSLTDMKSAADALEKVATDLEDLLSQ
ncbi:MAG: hypothetical protein VX262_03730 [Acidobacteriota bacterium]|nr:hypothetical protein [Acidobacteriota bacterium]